MIKKEELKLVTEWDKTFPKSDKVDHSKVTFVNRYCSFYDGLWQTFNYCGLNL